MYFLVDPVDAAAVKKTFLGLFILKKKKKKNKDRCSIFPKSI
jgi:hypothetical protein